jgi:hypothetical protein
VYEVKVEGRTRKTSIVELRVYRQDASPSVWYKALFVELPKALCWSHAGVELAVSL